MTVQVQFTDGKKQTFRGVRDVLNQDRDYRLPFEKGGVVLIPKHAVRLLEIEGR
jgi:hypothetical protein